MRTFINIMLLPIGLWAACTNVKKTQDFVPGTYVNHAESKYSIADDTLVITPDYQVTRHTTYNRRDGVPRKLVKHFTGVWDAGKQTLELTQTGTLLLFRPGELILGNNIYRKL